MLPTIWLRMNPLAMASSREKWMWSKCFIVTLYLLQAKDSSWKIVHVERQLHYDKKHTWIKCSIMVIRSRGAKVLSQNICTLSDNFISATKSPGENASLRQETYVQQLYHGNKYMWSNSCVTAKNAHGSNASSWQYQDIWSLKRYSNSKGSWTAGLMLKETCTATLPLT